VRNAPVPYSLTPLESRPPRPASSRPSSFLLTDAAVAG
jgi:hypothetical protein